jgi:hypothetical protein
MNRWILPAAIFLLALGLGYWLGYTFFFFKDVVPHGGMW